MSKHKEMKATQHKHDLADRRGLQQRRNHAVALLGCMVVLITALALMVPAISITKDVAEETPGIEVQSTQDEVSANAEGEGVDPEPAAEDPEPAAEDPEPAAEDPEPAAEDPEPAAEEPAADDPEPAADGAEADGDAVVQDNDAEYVDDAVIDDDAAVDDEEAEEVIVDATASSEGEVDSESDSDMPAQTFAADLKDADDNIVLSVSVEAPEGAFPIETTMKLDTIKAKDVASLEKKVDEAVKKAEGELAEVKQWQAVDITFFDKDGNEIEPAVDVEVKITSAKVNEIEKPLLVHVIDRTKESAKGKKVDAEVVEQVSKVNYDEKDKTVGNEDTFKFKTDEFSPYVIVETVIQNDEGELIYEGPDYTLKVTYTPEAEIPAGTQLTVSEIEKGTPEYEQCLYNAWKLLNKDYLEQQEEIARLHEAGDVDENMMEQLGGEIEVQQITDARYFDITLTLEGQKVEPKVPVTVEVTYKNGLDIASDATTQVVHFAEGGSDGALTPEAIENATVQIENGQVQSVVHEQESFSPTGYQVVEVAKEDEAPSTADESGSAEYTIPSLIVNDGAYNPEDIKIDGGKTVTPNNDDGTYTLKLDVVGQAITIEEPTKANVVIVLDFSGSMFGTENKFVYKEVSAPYPSSGTLYGYRGSGTIVSGACYTSSTFVTLTRSSSSPTGFTYNGNPYYGKVYTREYSWYSERAALRKLINTLMAYNEKWEGQDDVVEISLVGFGLYAKVLQDWTNSKDACLSAINGITSHLETYTNWEAGYRCAVDRVENIAADRADAPTYVMFLTDGNPNRYCNGEGWGKSVAATCSAANGIVYSRDDARKLVTDYGCTVYNIFSYGPSDQMPNLRRLNNYAQTGVQNDSTAQDNVTFFDASHDESLYNALATIASEISEGLTFGAVQVLDGITTGVTSTTVTTNGDVKNFRYAVKTEFGSTVYTVEQTGDDEMTFKANGATQVGTKKTAEFDYDGDGTIDETKVYYEATFGGATYKMCPAAVDSNGLITWDLGGVGALQPGWTYELSCIMWPEQECFDLLADLNNGDTTMEWDDSAATRPDGKDYTVGGFSQYPYIVKYDAGGYGVLTNTNQSIKYRIVETDPEGNVTYSDVQELPLEPQEPMPLDVSATQITKKWDDSLDPQELADVIEAAGGPDNYSVTLYVYKDTKTSTPFKTYTFKPTEVSEGVYTWPTYDISLPCGVMVSEAMASSSGLLTTSSCNDGNKVVIDGVTYYILEDGHEYWIEEYETDYHFEFEGDHIQPMEVDGTLKYVELDDEGNMIAIIEPEVFAGTNSLKGGLNVTKELEVPEGIDEINGMTISDFMYNATFDIKVDLFDSEGNPLSTGAAGSASEGLGYRIYYGEHNPNHGSGERSDKYAITNGTFTETIYVGDTIRIGNIPSGSTYSVYEVGESGGIMGMYNVTYTYSDEEKTIEANTADDVTVTNAVVVDNLTLVKVDVEDPGTAEDPKNPLKDAKFDLYGDDYYKADGTTVNPAAVPIMTDLVTGTDGKVEVGNLAYGTYYLVETASPANYLPLDEPIKIEFTRTGFAYYQDGNSLDSGGSGEGIYVDTAADPDEVVILITNSKGAVLPKTGGMGTLPFTIVGTTVIIMALGYGLLSRRRNEGRSRA